MARRGRGPEGIAGAVRHAAQRDRGRRLVDGDPVERGAGRVAGLVGGGAAGALIGAFAGDRRRLAAARDPGQAIGAVEGHGHVLVGPGARRVRTAVDRGGRGDGRGRLVDVHHRRRGGRVARVVHSGPRDRLSVPLGRQGRRAGAGGYLGDRVTTV